MEPLIKGQYNQRFIASKLGAFYSNNGARTLVFSIFFFSGVAGLGYEVSWTRQIGLLFGQTVQSASIVLACYFLGMAAGYIFGGKFAHRVKPLTGYAFCEIIAALWAFVIPLLLKLCSYPLLSAYLNHDIYSLQVGVRALVACILLLPATIALGGTLPFMAEYFSKAHSSKQAITFAYAMNIAGAFLGVVSATMGGIASLGVVGTSNAASVLSIFCAVGALGLGQRRETGSSPSFPPVQNSPMAPGISFLEKKWIALAAMSGFGLLALQVLYMRLFSLVLHNSVYSFGVVVAVFLVALVVASIFVAKFSHKIDAERGLFTACQSGGIAVAGSMLLFILWTGLEYFESGQSFNGYLAGVLGFSLAVMIAPIAILGVILPWVWTAVDKSELAANTVGRLTAINTFGAALGSLTASFILLPTLGLWGSFIAFAALYTLAPMFIFRSQRSKANWITTIATLGFLGMAYVAVSRYDGAGENEKVVKRWESAYGWVDVVKFTDSHTLQLRQNIHYGLGSTSSITMERRQAHLPLLLHPDPRDVLFIGLATGITAGGALDHPLISSVDVAELIPDVIRGAALFKDFNRDIVANPKANIVVNDGRHFLYAGSKQYDVIVADLFVPWESHTGYLYTVENYEAAIKRLKPGGLFCQWLPLWQLGERELRFIANSFAKVFPKTTVWYGKVHEHWTILGLVGSEGPIVLDPARLAERIANEPSPIPTDKSWFKTPDDIFKLYAGDWVYDEKSDLNTDENPRVEFSTPITAWTRGSRLRFDTLLEFFDRVLVKLPAKHLVFLEANADEKERIERIRKDQRFKLSKEE